VDTIAYRDLYKDPNFDQYPNADAVIHGNLYKDFDAD
jgi:hypothetical protein